MTKTILLILSLLVPIAASAQTQLLLPLHPPGMTACDGIDRTWAAWTNHTGHTLLVQRIETWAESDFGDPFPPVRMYTTIAIDRQSPYVLLYAGWLLYTPPSSDIGKERAYASGTEPRIEPNETVKVFHACRAQNLSRPTRSQTGVTLWYTEAP